MKREKEDFRLGAPVYSRDGKHVGSVHRTLVDQTDFELKAIVVEESRSFSGHLLAPGTALIIPDVVVPIDAVRDATDDRVDLSLSSEQVRRLSPYLTYRRLPLTPGQLVGEILTAAGGNPTVPTLEETAVRPAGEIEIDPGENVMLGRTGRNLGRVKEVLFDGDELIGIVMQPEGFFKGPVILPRRFLERSDDAALFVQLTEDDLKHLQPFVPA